MCPFVLVNGTQGGPRTLPPATCLRLVGWGEGVPWILGLGVPPKPNPLPRSFKSTPPATREGSFDLKNVDLAVVTAGVIGKASKYGLGVGRQFGFVLARCLSHAQEFGEAGGKPEVGLGHILEVPEARMQRRRQRVS